MFLFQHISISAVFNLLSISCICIGAEFLFRMFISQHCLTVIALTFQHACPGHMGRAVGGAAPVHRGLPAITCPASVAAPLVSLAMAVNRVSDSDPHICPAGVGGFIMASLLIPSCFSPACLPGTYGLNCNQVCQCSEANQLCHPVTGLCYCAPGYHGKRCNQGESSLESSGQVPPFWVQGLFWPYVAGALEQCYNMRIRRWVTGDVVTGREWLED